MGNEKTDEGRKATEATVTGETLSPQAQEIRNRWWWIKHQVWTVPMLARLEKNEPGTRWFRLWDKVFEPRTLEAGFWGVWRKEGAPGVDGQTVEEFEEGLTEEIQKLSQELRSGTYRPCPSRRQWIPKPGTTEKRPLGIPGVRDRTVQGALKAVLEPIFEREFAEQSYGFRPGRGCREAVARVRELLQEGYTVVVDADLKGYFDSIPHDRLMAKLRERIADGKVMGLVRQFLEAGVMDEMQGWEPTDSGTPQGGVISPLLANVYLNDLDHQAVRLGWQMVRYADDFVILCRDEDQARNVMNTLREWVGAAGLTLHPTKTRVVNYGKGEGFDFLGWHFERGYQWPRDKSLEKLRTVIREKTPRTSGESLPLIITRLNRTLKGWHGYFKDSVKNVLVEQDQFIRRRLRALLRKREKRPGSGKTHLDHQKWTNRWLSEQGLFSLRYGSCEYR